MKTKNLLWAALSMTAALVMTACSNDDNDMTEAPVAPSTSKTIPYTVTVGGDEATTRATVDGDNKTLRFATGDKLYITGTNIQGVLNITDGVGAYSGATFSGELTYTGGGSPTDGLSLTATLVSEQQEGTNKISVDATTGAVTVNYPSNAYCSSINDAVQKYSNLTGTSTYGARAFTLTQQTAFLNFVITFEDGTTAGTELTAVVNNNNSSDICSASVTTVTDNGVKAKFVLPVASGTELSSATVTMGSKAALAISDATLTGKVYNVTRTQAAAAPALTSATTADVGKIAGADGKIYATKDAAEAVATGNAIAMIAYVGTASDCTTGLAIALEDVGNTYTWAAAAGAVTTWASGKTAPTTGSWRLPSEKDWQYMFIGCGSSESYSTPTAGMNKSYSELASKLTTAQGDALQSDYYWSSTEIASPSGSTRAWSPYFGNGNWAMRSKTSTSYVRACLAF